MKKIITLFFCLISLSTFAQGSFAWGVKGGLSAGFQTWNNYQRDPLFRYHGDIYIETYDGPDANALYAQAGYHVRGSALRNQNFTNVLTGQVGRLPTQAFIFNNVAISTGFKQRFDLGLNKGYYAVGIRGEYTLSDNLDDFQTLNTSIGSLYFPFPEAVRDFNYGLTLSGGLEFNFSELIGGIVEFSLSPDLSDQYRQPAIANVYDPFTGTERTIPERKIRNITAEISVGFRFLRIVEYID